MTLTASITLTPGVATAGYVAAVWIAANLAVLAMYAYRYWRSEVEL